MIAITFLVLGLAFNERCCEIASLPGKMLNPEKKLLCCIKFEWYLQSLSMICDSWAMTHSHQDRLRPYHLNNHGHCLYLYLLF